MLPKRAVGLSWALVAFVVVTTLSCVSFAQSGSAGLVFPASTSAKPLEPPPVHTATETSAPAPGVDRHKSRVRLRVIVPEFASAISVVSTSQQVVAKCNGSCDLWLATGDYTIVAIENDGSSSEHDLELHEATTITLSPSNGGLRNLGVAMGLLGPVVVVLGIAVGVSSIVGNIDAEHDSDRDSSSPLPTAIVLAGGGMTAGGWILYAKNRNPKLSQDPPGTAMSSGSLHVGATRLPGGAAVAATLTF